MLDQGIMQDMIQSGNEEIVKQQLEFMLATAKLTLSPTDYEQFCKSIRELGTAIDTRDDDTIRRVAKQFGFDAMAEIFIQARDNDTTQSQE